MCDKTEPLISIVIPVFNVEKYLRTCVDSILAQSFRDYEIILVNDGSTDGCPKICDDYAGDEHVRVIHKENKGVSDARNKGILSSRGKYLLFIDSDDFIAENSLMAVAETIARDGETDVVLLNTAHYYDTGKIKHFTGFFNKEILYKKSKNKALNYLTSLSDFTTSVCLKLIDRQLLISNKIFFEDITWGEDTDFCLKLFLHSETFNYCNSYIYYYRKERLGSATFSFSEKKIRDLLHVISKWVKKTRNDSFYNQYSEAIYNFLSFQYCLLISGVTKITPPVKRSFYLKAKKYSWLLYRSKDRRVALVGYVYRILGLRLTSYCLRLYERLIHLIFFLLFHRTSNSVFDRGA